MSKKTWVAYQMRVRTQLIKERGPRYEKKLRKFYERWYDNYIEGSEKSPIVKMVEFVAGM